MPASDRRLIRIATHCCVSLDDIAYVTGGTIHTKGGKEIKVPHDWTKEICDRLVESGLCVELTDVNQ